MKTVKQKKYKAVYVYNGPVRHFEHIVKLAWVKETSAVSPAQALNNLKFRAKQEFGYAFDSKLSLDPKCLYLKGEMF